jgi:hypothetical protein
VMNWQVLGVGGVIGDKPLMPIGVRLIPGSLTTAYYQYSQQLVESEADFD